MFVLLASYLKARNLPVLHVLFHLVLVRLRFVHRHLHAVLHCLLALMLMAANFDDHPIGLQIRAYIKYE